MGSVEESPKKMNITIIGGSLSGLIHGVALKCRGHNVTILERRPASDTASQGAGLSAGPSAQEFMNTFDKIPTPWAVMTKGQFVINKDAEQMMYWPNPMSSTSWDIIYYRLRANFDGMKSRYCQQDLPRVEGEGKVHYMDGITVDNLRYEDGNVFIDYSNAAGTPGVIKSDLVIAADGSSSKVRRMLLPEVERQYLGYCGWRGVVPESELSVEKNNPDSTPTFCAFKDGFIMKYLIPGKDGSIEKGRRLMNYVWYQQAPEGSQQLRDQFTDVEGNTHRYTLPIGKMRPEEVEKMRATAHEMLDPHTAEIVCKTANPFVQSITSVNPKRATFFNGKLLLVGDALATFRPMSSAGINQSSVDALALIRMLDGKISLQEWEKEVLEYAATAQAEGLQRQGLFYFTEARKAQMATGGAGAAGGAGGYTGKPVAV